MPLFDNIMQRLFPRDKEVSVHEVLKRNPAFMEAFDQWKASGQLDALLDPIMESYRDKLADRRPAVDIEVFHSPYANGIILYPGEGGVEIHMEFLMEYIREALEEVGYRMVHADRKLREKGSEVQSLEKYYLKPPMSADLPIDQLFGNVILELYHKNKRPVKLRMMVNVYSDRLYSDPRSFEDLIFTLFEKNTGS